MKNRFMATNKKEDLTITQRDMTTKIKLKDIMKN